MRNILITGAGSGLGQALAIQLANVETRLILVDISELGLQQTAHQLKDIGQYKIFCVDLGNRMALQESLDSILQEKIDIDWIINCAGVTLTSKTQDISDAQWQSIFSINVMAPIVIIQFFLASMLERRQGKIINISSMFGMLPAPSGIAYAATKHAIIGYSRTLMVELEGTGVDVHLVCPGFIDTKLFEHAEYNNVDKQRILPDTTSMISADQAAEKIIKGIESRKEWIVFPFYVRVLWWLEYLFPALAKVLWRKQWYSFKELTS